MADDSDREYDAYLRLGNDLTFEDDRIRVRVGKWNADDRQVVDLDIRDAVYLRYLLDGAISDYERAVGK